MARRPRTPGAVVTAASLALIVAAGCGSPPPSGDAPSPPPSAPSPRARPPAPRIEDVVASLLDGSLRPEDCGADVLAAAAPLVMDVDWSTGHADCAARLELVRRMGPAAAGVVAQVIDWGRLDEAGHAALDAIDPDKTLRIPVFLAQHGTAGREIDAGEGLFAVGPDVIPRLVAVVDGSQSGNAFVAAQVLEEFGPEAVAAIPALRRQAQHGDHADSRVAAAALFRVSGGRDVVAAPLARAMIEDDDLCADVVAARGTRLVEDFAPLLKSTDAEVRTCAARVLADAAPETAGLAPALASGLADRDSDTRNACRAALVRMGERAAEAVPTLVELWDAANPHDVAAVLAATRDRERALPALRAAFASAESDGRRGAAARAIVSFGRDDSGLLLGPLRAALAETFDVYSRWSHQTRKYFARPWAAECLSALGEDAAPATSALVAALDERSAAVDESVEALGKIGRAAVPELVRALASSESASIRRGAARALGRIDRAGDAATSALRAAFGDADVSVRGCAAAAILRLVPGAPDAVPILADALASPDKGLHAEWLDVLGPANVVALAAVRRAAGQSDPNVRIAAARAERRITGDAKPLVEEIAAAISLTNGEWSAVRALRELGADGRDAVPAVAAAIARDQRCGRDLADALAALGPDARAAVPALASVVAVGLDHDVADACRALQGIGPAAAEAVPALVRRLERTSGWPDEEIVGALGAIGPAAAPALPAIRPRLRNYYRSTRDGAREAIARIERE